MKNNTMMPRKILGGEQRQSLPVNIQPMVACALRKIKNKTRDQSLLKIDPFLHFFQWLDACHRRDQCV